MKKADLSIRPRDKYVEDGYKPTIGDVLLIIFVFIALGCWYWGMVI